MKTITQLSRIVVVIVVVLIFGIQLQPVAAAPTLTGNTTLHLDSLPSSQSWNYQDVIGGLSETDVFNLYGDVLQQRTFGKGTTAASYRRSGVPALNTSFTLIINVAIENDDGPCGFDVAALADLEYELCIGKEGIFSGNGTVFPSTIDVGQMHTYRMQGIPGVGYELFVDGVSLGTSSGEPGIPGANYISFGDQSSTSNSDADIGGACFFQGWQDDPGATALANTAAALSLCTLDTPYHEGTPQNPDVTTKGWENDNHFGTVGEITTVTPSTIYKGLDCSGLIFWAYNLVVDSTAFLYPGDPGDKPVNWEGSALQFDNNFTQDVDRGDLLPGDAIFSLDSDETVYHVAMYVGRVKGEQTVVSTNPSKGVHLVDLDIYVNFDTTNTTYKYRRRTRPAFRPYTSVYSPVYLNVTDPNGFTITPDTTVDTGEELLHEVPGVFDYSVSDIDGNGEDNDMVTFLTLKPGPYLIQPVPKPGAAPTDTYSLDIVVPGQTLTLAQDVQIQNIPSGGYTVTWTGSEFVTSAPGAQQEASQASPAPGLCSLSGGGTNSVVAASVPGNTVTGGNVFCRIINQNGSYVRSSAEIGDINVINRGVLQAVDVFGLTTSGQSVIPFNNPVQICLAGQGDLLFIDAASTPRTVNRLAITMQGGYTCGSIPNSGTVVLVPASADDPPVQPPAGTSANNPTALSDGVCQVTTLYRVNLRSDPTTDAAIIAELPYNETFTATARQGDWIRVIYANTQGWIDMDYVKAVGDCGG